MLKKTLILVIFSLIGFATPRLSSISSAENYNGNYSRNDNFYSSFSLTSNNNFCVGQTPTYQIFGGTPNATINWTSSGPLTQSQMSFQLNASGTFSGNGNAWQTSDVGSWTKTATMNGISQVLHFTVNNCGNIPAGGNINSNNTTSGNSYYDPYNNNILQPLGGTNNSNYMAPGNTYYDPYKDNIFQPFTGPTGSNLYQNPTPTNNQNYMAPGNTYYNPYTHDVPCIDTKC